MSIDGCRGSWATGRYETDAPTSSGQSFKVTGIEHVRTLGEIWVLAEAQGEMPGGGPATSLMTLGFNPDSGRFTGTWIGLMMTHMWPYDGELDTDGRVLTLDSEGPSMSGDGTMSRYRDVIELEGDDRRTLTASVKGEDGQWRRFMTTSYRRAGARV